jgi:hypothetical protein
MNENDWFIIKALEDLLNKLRENVGRNNLEVLVR